MIIPTKQLHKWATLKEQGDLTRLVTASEKAGTKITRQTFAKALEVGRCSQDAYKVLKNYFTKKEKELQKLTT